VSTYQKLIEKARGYLEPDRLALVEKAYRYASKAHQGQNRLSGEPYEEHPLQAALTLAEMEFDATALAAALLHDVVENCGIPLADLKAEFGAEVAKLVDGTTKMGKLSRSGRNVAASELQVENLRKMLVAMAEDLRVVFIKLADRLHNMYTLGALPAEKRHKIAQETMEIYAPLAHRLGIWELKWQLEDLSFRHLKPKQYRGIAKLLDTRRSQRESFLKQVEKALKTEFARLEMKADVSARPKHIYSIYQKMERYAAQGKAFDDIHDLLALRVLVHAVPDCYAAVGVIHSLWRPLPEEFNDFIANPKPNGYQSLHTVVMYGVTPVEIQIRTHEMHRIAEYGVAAHWRYKEGEKEDIRYEERIGWLRQLVEWQRELSGAEEFLESIKTDIFIDQVFVFTPKGEIRDLPKGSTPLDFAYRVHTELGHRCIGANVNGRLVSFNYQLKNGDVVEIRSAKGEKGPSRDWLNPQLGYIKTSHARGKIRQWFKRREREENIEHGRELLAKDLRRLGIKMGERELAKMFNYDSLEDFLAAIGYGGITSHQIASKLAAEHEKQPSGAHGAAPPKPSPSSIKVLGVGDMVTQLAQCCHPVPGDNITGYITRGRGVSIHRQDCYNVKHVDDSERLVSVEWGTPDGMYPVNVQLESWDKVGLIRDVTTIVAEEKVNIAVMHTVRHGDHTSTTSFTFEIGGLAQLSRLLGRIEAVRGVIGVTRVGDEATVKKDKAT